MRTRIESLLPTDWSFEGKRVLDFGCGSARVLRHFLDEARRGELWGCDIDGPSIDWIEAHLSPPLSCFRNDVEPPLPLADDYLDLIWATSVFTHIDHWSPWIVELHRVLAPGGRLIVTFLGEGMWEALVGEPFKEDEVGMTVLGHWRGAGADILHSEWWLREHWGRAFEVLEVARPPRGADGSPQTTHSYISLRKRQTDLTVAGLEDCDAAEVRELAGLQTNIRLLRRELDTFAQARRSAGPARFAMRDLVLRSPLGGPARRLRDRLRGER